MASSMLDFLAPLLPGAFERIVFPAEIRSLLEHLSTATPLPTGTTTPGVPAITGEVKASANDTAGGFAQLDLDPLGPAIDFELRVIGLPASPTGFQLDLKPASGLLKLPAACRPASVELDAAGKPTLVEGPAGGRVALTLNGADPLAIRIEGSVEQPAEQRIVPLDAAGQGVMTVGLDPPAFMLGSQGFGLNLPGWLVIDSSKTSAPAPVEHGDGRPLPSETAAWEGVAIRQAELFLPERTPLLGVGPVPIEFELGTPNGLYGHTEVHLPEADGRPACDVSLTWDDPGATSLAAALPTAIEIRTAWSLDQTSGVSAVGTIELLGGRPLRVTGRFARTPGTSDLEFGLEVEAGGDEGLLSVQATSAAGKVVVTATALATAFIADAQAPTQPGYDGSGATLGALLAAAAALSGFVEGGSVTVNGVEIDAGLGAAGTKLTLRVDYSVDVLVTAIDLGFLHIGMKHDADMRLRYRNVRLLVDFAQSGLDRYHLSFGEADVGVEQPGGWVITPAGNIADLFDVLGSRSGHGSQWFEIDLQFALDLGPVKVSGATVRVTLGHDGALKPELRGLEASLDVPGLLQGSGKASLGDGRLDLALAAQIVPLNVGGFARLSYGECEGVDKLILALGVDLPGPIPLANSGLGLFGLGGIFGVNAALPAPPPGADPVEFQLGIDPLEPAKYACARGGSVVGLGAVLGTAPDLGFTFSTRAVIVIGLPDLALRASLDGKVLSERVKMGSFGTPPTPGLSFLGLLVIDDDGVTIAMRGNFSIPVLFTIAVPFGAHFPSKGPADDWYVRLGSDGVKDRKSPGAIQAKVLPDILNVGASAYLMVEGDGIESLGGDPTMSLGGFAIGFGAGFNAEYGVPLINLQLAASAIVGIGSNPFFLAGKGRLSGSLHLGPVSIGVSAEIALQVGPDLDDAWIRFEVCGEVDLFFFSLGGCVKIEIGERSEAIPPPHDWPLASIPLADHRYTRTAEALRADGMPGLDAIPVAWPDTIPILQFTTGPANRLEAGPFRDKLAWDAGEVGDGVVGNERLSYSYALQRIELTAIDPHTLLQTPVAGPLEAAWQVPKTGASGEPGARELALLTWESGLWTRKLADGAVEDSHDPLGKIARRCRAHYEPMPGWALGALGVRHGPGEAWRLPTEPTSGPFASKFAVRVAAQWWQTPLDESTVALLPVSFPFQLGGPTRLHDSLSAAGHDFAGAFDLPHVVDIPSDVNPDRIGALNELPVVVTLRFSEALLDPVLALLLLPSQRQSSDVERLDVRLIDFDGRDTESLDADTFTTFPLEDEEQGPDGGIVRVYAQGGGPYSGVRISYPAVLDVQVLGVRGTTEAASQGAEQATQAAQAAGQTAKTHAATLTPRAMLTPNTIYRIDVTVAGQGKRPGVSSPAPTVHTDSYWFRTPDMSGPAPSGGEQYPQTSSELAKLHYDEFVLAPSKLLRTDRFDPAYLERYILSWMPADKALFWFPHDPVAVQFEVKHVPDLAAVYDHDTKLSVRRSDPTKGHPDPFEVQEIPATTLYQAVASLLQPAADLKLHELASAPGSCPYPTPGATLGGRPQLQPRAQYEMLLAFPFRDSTDTGSSGGAEIRGGTFTTSRYLEPQALLAELGFGDSVPVGAIAVEQVAVAPGELTASGAVAQALANLGLGRLPPPRQARTIGLWTRDGESWSLHGVLLDAPEPIHRPDTLGLVGFGGRILIESLKTAGRGFEQVIRSGSGERLLFLTGAPLTPGPTLELGVTLQQVPLEAATTPASSTVSAPIDAIPAFAGDLT